MAMFGNKKELESYGDRGEIRPSYSKTPVFHRNSLDESWVTATNGNHNVVTKPNCVGELVQPRLYYHR